MFWVLDKDNIEAIFKDFWVSGCWDTETSYILKQTSVQTVKHWHADNLTQNSSTRSYHVTVNGITVTVCKLVFANNHGTSEAHCDRAQKRLTTSCAHSI